MVRLLSVCSAANILLIYNSRFYKENSYLMSLFGLSDGCFLLVWILSILFYMAGKISLFFPFILRL